MAWIAIVPPLAPPPQRALSGRQAAALGRHLPHPAPRGGQAMEGRDGGRGPHGPDGEQLLVTAWDHPQRRRRRRPGPLPAAARAARPAGRGNRRPLPGAGPGRRPDGDALGRTRGAALGRPSLGSAPGRRRGARAGAVADRPGDQRPPPDRPGSREGTKTEAGKASANDRHRRPPGARQRGGHHDGLCPRGHAGRPRAPDSRRAGFAAPRPAPVVELAPRAGSTWPSRALRSAISSSATRPAVPARPFPAPGYMRAAASPAELIRGPASGGAGGARRPWGSARE